MTDNNQKLIITRFFLDSHGQLFSLAQGFATTPDTSVGDIRRLDDGLVKRGQKLYPGATLYIPSEHAASTDIGSDSTPDKKGELVTETYWAVCLERLDSGNRLCFYVDNPQLSFASSAKLWLDDEKPHVRQQVEMISDLTAVYLQMLEVGQDEYPALAFHGNDILAVTQAPKVNDWTNPPKGVVMLDAPLQITWRKVPKIDKKTGQQATYKDNPVFYYFIHKDDDTGLPAIKVAPKPVNTPAPTPANTEIPF